MGEDKILITDIIKKVRGEIKNLEIEKNVISGSLKELNAQIRDLYNMEKKTRSKIESLMKKETELSQKRAELEKRLVDIKKKISKLSEAQKSISEAF